MRVIIPAPLGTYTGSPEVQAEGATLRAVFADLDRRFPGIRFRMIDEQEHIRPHIKIFVNQTIAPDLDTLLAEEDRVRIIMAISGGSSPPAGQISLRPRRPRFAGLAAQRQCAAVPSRAPDEVAATAGRPRQAAPQIALLEWAGLWQDLSR